MNTSPLVSILIITMNHEKFIEQACKSAISQTYPNFEIILLDNNSSDQTYNKAKDILDNCNIPNTIIRNSESYSSSKNLNILVSKASGDYVSILSGDDWYTPNCIEEKIKFFAENKIDFAISDGYKYIESESKLVDAYTEKAKSKIINSLDNFFHINVTHNEPINVGVFIKRELIVKHPFDEEILAEDWDMNLRFTSLGYKIGFINKKLFYYRILPLSLSSRWDLMENSYLKITQKYIDYINSDNALKKNYEVNLIKYKYLKFLSKTDSELEKKAIQKKWKAEKYKIKYKHPVLFFKLLLLR